MQQALAVSDVEAGVGVNESSRRAIKQIRVLWPYLTFEQRYEWVEHFRHHYNDELARTVEALSGFALGARPSLSHPTWQ